MTLRTRVVDLRGQRTNRLDYRRAVEEVLRTLPEGTLEGLDAVLLRDTASLTTAEKRAGFGRSTGVFVRPGKNRPAAIHLFLDLILAVWPRWASRVPWLRHEIVFRTLFHEVAHHVQEREAPGKPHDEEEIRIRGIRLHRASFRDRHPVAAVLLGGIYRALDPLVRRMRKGRSREVPS